MPPWQDCFFYREHLQKAPQTTVEWLGRGVEHEAQVALAGG